MLAESINTVIDQSKRLQPQRWEISFLQAGEQPLESSNRSPGKRNGPAAKGGPGKANYIPCKDRGEQPYTRHCPALGDIQAGANGVLTVEDGRSQRKEEGEICRAGEDGDGEHGAFLSWA